MRSHSSEMTAPGFDPGSICPQAHVFCSSHLQALSLISTFLLHAEPWAGPDSLALPAWVAPPTGMVTGAIWVPSQGHGGKSLWSGQESRFGEKSSLGSHWKEGQKRAEGSKKHPAAFL